MTTDPLREAVGLLLLVVDGWQAEGLGTCPQIARTNYPDAWTDVLDATEAARAALAATAPTDGPRLRVGDLEAALLADPRIRITLTTETP